MRTATTPPTEDDDDEEGARREAADPAAGLMDDDELQQLIEDKLTNAMGAPGTQIATERLRNLDAYLAEPTGEWAPPEIDDRSDLVATDAADTVEWMLPSLLRVFAAGKDAIEVTARRPQFEADARIVRAYLQWLFWDKLDGMTFLHGWLKDGLMVKVGFARVDFCSAEVRSTEPYRGITLAQAQHLLSAEGVRIIAAAERTETTPLGPVQVYDLDIERTEYDGHPAMATVPPEEMRIDNAARYGREPAFIAQEYTKRRSELEAEGFDVSDVTGTGSNSWPSNTEAHARRRVNSAVMFEDDDDDDEELRVVDAYLRRGSENAPTWIRGLIIGDKLKKQERVDDHPFVWWCPNPFPHVFFGQCPVDYAIQPQRLRTKLLRAVEDNVYLTVNGRTGVVGGDADTIDDILDSRPGGVVRLKTKDDLVPIVQPDLSGAAWTAVEWAEQWNEKRTGFSRLSKGLSSDALNDTARGVVEITERADMRTELTARHAAAALSKLMSKLLRLASRNQDVSQMIQIAGQWVDIDPRDWENQYNVRVRVGLGTGNKDRQTAQLSQLMQVQQGLAQGGMVPPQAVISLARKLTETMGFEQPEQWFPDPPPPNPNQPPPLPLQIEQMKGQVSVQVEQARLQAKLQETQAALQLQSSNDQRDSEREVQKAQLEAQIQRQQQENDILIAQMQEQNRRLIAELEQQTKLQIAAMNAQATQAPQIDTSGLVRLEQTMAAIHEAINTPKAVIRDPKTGRVIGSAPVRPQPTEPEPKQ